MQSTTTAEDILKALLQCTNSMGVDLKKIIFVTIDGASEIFAKILRCYDIV